LSCNVHKLRMSANAPRVSRLIHQSDRHVLLGLVLVDGFYAGDGSPVCKAPVRWSYAWVVCVWSLTELDQPVSRTEAVVHRLL